MARIVNLNRIAWIKIADFDVENTNRFETNCTFFPYILEKSLNSPLNPRTGCVIFENNWQDIGVVIVADVCW